MPGKKALEKKSAEVKELSEKINGAKGVVIVDYRGITVEDVTKLRADLRAVNAEYIVIKNNITRRALKECGIEDLDEALDNGHPVIALIGKASIFTDYGHFIVLAGKTPDGKYIVNDPNIENYYQPHLVDGFTNGFTKEQVTRGLNGIYIFGAI